MVTVVTPVVGVVEDSGLNSDEDELSGADAVAWEVLSVVVAVSTWVLLSLSL